MCQPPMSGFGNKAALLRLFAQLEDRGLLPLEFGDFGNGDQQDSVSMNGFDLVQACGESQTMSSIDS
jgi:hypothetical protein